MSNHIIETERHGLWIAVTFILALLALSVGVVSMVRVQQVGVATQLEVLALHKRIQKIEKGAAPVAAPAAAEAAPAADAAPVAAPEATAAQ